MLQFKFLAIVLLTPLLSYSQAVDKKECSSRNSIKTQLEKRGVSFEDKATRIDLTSDYFENLNKAAGEIHAVDPQFLKQKKRFDELVSAKEIFVRDIEKLGKAQKEFSDLKRQYQSAEPSKSNDYKAGNLEKLKKEMDQKDVEVGKLQGSIGALYQRSRELSALWECNAGEESPAVPHRGQLLQLEKTNTIVGQLHNLRRMPPNAEDCRLLLDMASQEKESLELAGKKLLKPLSAHKDGTFFAKSLSFKSYGKFDSVEMMPQRDGSTLWLLKNKNTITKAIVISGKDEGKKDLTIISNDDDFGHCMPNVEVFSGVSKLESSEKYDKRLLVNEDICANPPRSQLVPNKKEMSDLCYQHFPRPAKAKVGGASSGAR